MVLVVVGNLNQDLDLAPSMPKRLATGAHLKVSGGEPRVRAAELEDAGLDLPSQAILGGPASISAKPALAQHRMSRDLAGIPLMRPVS